MTEAYRDWPRSEVLPHVPRVGSLLDVGCWRGAFGASVKERDPACRVVGLEPNPASAATAAERLDEVIVGTFPEAAPPGPFTCITFLDVLEHMVDPWTAVAAARPLLSEDGVVVASIPNVRNAQVVADLLLRGRWDYRDAGILDRTHLRFFTRATMVELFERAGFTVSAVVPINPLTDGRLSRLLRPFGRRTIELRATQFVVVAT